MFKNNIMSKIIIEKFNYSHLLVIDSDKYNIYQNLIKTLKDNNIIDTKFNKINFLVNDTCIIYNINDNDKEYDIIKKFIIYYKHKLDKHNIKFILLNRYDNKIYVIKTKTKNHIVCHSKLIKKLFNINYFNLLIKYIIINYDKENIQNYFSQLIKQLLINIVNENIINKKCFNNTYSYILQWKVNNDNDIKFLNKTVIIKY